MMCHFTILFPNEKTPPNACIPDYLPNSHHHFWNQTINEPGWRAWHSGFHYLGQFPGWDFPNFHISSLASQYNLHLVPVLFANFGGIETFFDVKTINKRAGILGADCFP
jgi:hypothetical protein